jgi:uncharacterized protein (DUF433 family)
MFNTIVQDQSICDWKAASGAPGSGLDCLKLRKAGTIEGMSIAPIAQPKQHITSTSGVCGGRPCIVGTRVRVWDIAVLAQAGESPDEVLTHFPHLTLSDVHAALAYYYDNREMIDEQATQDERFAQELRRTAGPGPLEEKLQDPAT